MSTPFKWSQLRTAWQSAWQQRNPREQRMLSLGGLVVALAAIWILTLAPALRTWQDAARRQGQLDAQSQRMRQLQAQAQSLQKPRTITRAEAALWLEQNLAELGPSAQISMQGERATLRVQAAPAEALARWLSQARENAQALPVQAKLQQTAAPTPTTKAPQTPVGQTPKPPTPNNEGLWRGTLLLRLP